MVVVFPHMRAVICASLFLGFSHMVMPPLQALVAQLAPPDRVSEAMGAVGAFKCMASVLGNLFVFLGIPLLRRTGLRHPLWLAYPCCGLLSLSAVLFVLRLPAGAIAEAQPQAETVAETKRGAAEPSEVSTEAEDPEKNPPLQSVSASA